MTVPAFAAIAALLGQTATLTLPCVPLEKAEAVVTTMAPELLRATAGVCAPNLPDGAYLRRPIERLTEKYVGAGDAAWPAARAALAGLLPRDARTILDSELARPLLAGLVAPLLTKQIKPRDCADIDRLLALLDPLPARNTAALIVTIVELSRRGRAPSDKAPFTICPPKP